MCADQWLIRQINDGLAARIVKALAWSDPWRQCGVPDSLARANRFKGTHHHLPCPGAMGVFGQAMLEQLSVGQDDAQLIVQKVKEFCQVRVGDRRLLVNPGHCEAHAVRRRFWSSLEALRGALASRHRVSVKMRTEPPAVRMYSTFPLEIQL
jgi:hypothetical protein